jgi:hypothetical protein
MTKRILYTLIALGVYKNISAQQVIDAVNPLFSENRKAGEIGKLYDNFEVSIPTKPPPEGKLYNDVILSIFHSKNLYVNTVFNKQNEIRELAAFKLGLNEHYAQLVGAYKNTSAVPLFDSVPVVVTAYGINPANKNIYRFRVLKNKTEEVIPWSEIKFFSPVFMYYRYNVDGTEQTEMAYLGQFIAPVGNSITIEVKNIKMPDTTCSISAVWIKRAPAIIATFTPQSIQQLIAVYKYQWKYDHSGVDGPSYYGDISLPPIDSLLSIKHRFTHNENNIFFYLNDKANNAALVEYNFVWGKDSSGWKSNSFDANLIRLRELKAGKYTLLLRYAFQRQTVSSFSFSIIPAWYQSIWFTMVAGILLLLSGMSVLLIIKNNRQKTKLKEQRTQHQVTQAEIKSIKSQFNPHFVFNALNSIQGLITKNDIESAHAYLSDFSRLLRNSLKESEHDFTSLSKDIALIDNYLKLEQLRFGFHYQISIDETINKDAVEVPVLLFQPVIENAVKHGIAGLYKNGVLKIDYAAKENDIIVTVTDNGTGYSNIQKGHGLKLTGDRIALLNKLLKGQSVHWQANSTGSGTRVLFIFKNWLL